jgi:adenylate cyclase
VTSALSETGDLRVVARTSAFHYKGKSLDIRQIGRELNASAILEGSITKSEGKS